MGNVPAPLPGPPTEYKTVFTHYSEKEISLWQMLLLKKAQKYKEERKKHKCCWNIYGY